MQSYLDTLRKHALSAVWSQGVKLARDHAVSRVSASAGEMVLRVRAPGLAIAPTVTLYVTDEEWSCDCGGKVDPCSHVVAAAIAAAQGEAEVSLAPQAKPALLSYQFGKKDRKLTMQRIVFHPDGRQEPLGAALSSVLAQGRTPKDLVPTHEDLLVDRIVGASHAFALPLGRIGDIFRALESHTDITLDGAPIRVSGDPVLPRAVLGDAKSGGFVLRIERDPAVTEVYAMGVVRTGQVLHPLAETNTTGEFLEHLPLVRTFSRDEETELVTKVLPELEKTLPVMIATNRLRRTSKDALPRIAMDLSHQGHTLSVLPTLVYGDPPIARVDGDKVVALGKILPVRRRDEERAIMDRLRDELNLVPGRRVDFDGHEAVRFAAKLRAWQERMGDAGVKEFERKPLAGRIVFENGTFDVIFEVGEPQGTPNDCAETPKRASPDVVMRAWRDGLDLVPLDGGGWAPLPADWLAKHGSRVADLLAARSEDKKLIAAALPELGALCEALDMPKPFELGRLAPLIEGFSAIPPAKLAADLTATLRHYQQTGVDWLSFLRDSQLGGVLADDMGLGKTLQAICAFQGRVLVVCPKSVVYNWAEEIARFRPGLRTSIYHGTNRELDASADVTLTTYAVLRLDTVPLAATEWDVIVLDEAQAIKNETSQTARAAFQLRGVFRLALSGTPIENRLEELWSIMHFVNPGLLGGRSDFQERYALPIANGSADVAKRLQGKIRPFVLRRMKREVLPELPPRSDSVLYVELDETERSVYDAVRVATKKEVSNQLGQGSSVLAVLEALLRLRQAACHSALVPGQKGGGGSAQSSSKIERLLGALEDASSEGHKALVFSQWTSLLDLVEPHLEAAGIRFTRLDGSTRDRGSVVSEFQNDAELPVMLVSLKAGGTGLNLTAADHVFLLDPWWNPAVEDQAADRAHRIGQQRPVMVYRMVARDTVEERIFALQAKKRALVDVALGETNHQGGITREELLALLD
ncbi:MAG: DEAD/DEAH box helicase [Polyangiaceae bacterium]|nr:DEAD/DEAH box helicase [Polyangiaceae bacterium]